MASTFDPRGTMNQVLRLKRILDQEHELGLLIMATPSGPIREVMTEANIHLMTACQKLNEVEQLLRKQLLK